MLQHPFAIEFHFTDGTTESTDVVHSKYQAVITTLSKSFQLFKVSSIRKITKEQMTELDACYHITPHPLTDEKDESWKDALTRNTDAFVQAIGKAIEQHIYTSQKVAPYLN